jgi:hypothetical protein
LLGGWYLWRFPLRFACHIPTACRQDRRDPGFYPTLPERDVGIHPVGGLTQTLDCYNLYTMSKTFFDAPYHNLTVSQVLYIRILFLLLNTIVQVWSRLISFCNELLYIISFDLYTVSMSLSDAT